MSNNQEGLRRYIVMSKDSYLADPLNIASLQPSTGTIKLATRARVAAPAPKMRVLDSLHENGPKLVEMGPEGELSLRLSSPHLKIIPEVFYHRQWERFRVHQRPARPAGKKVAVKKAKKTAAKKGAKTADAGRMKLAAGVSVSATSFKVSVVASSGGRPIGGAHIVAFTNFAARQGSEATTGANGQATLKLLSPNQALERVYVYAPPGFWGFYAANTTGTKLAQIKLTPIDVRDPTLLLTQLYGKLPANAGTGVTVGIIDSGVDGTHPDLRNVTGGLNCVSDEVRGNPAAAQNWRPALTEGEHGTHVAGIVGGSGSASGFRGVAPGVKLRSYRVFPDHPRPPLNNGASNFDIAKAIDTAVAEKCDIINMSLGGGPKDDLTRAAIDRAIAAGVVVVAAAGNDDRQPVSFPAAFVECVAVSAMGRIGSFPKTSIGSSDVASPKGSPLATDFVADFSNFGPEIDTTGPGVEIVSTLPGTSHGSLSGTSMACPAVAGFAAYLLAKDAALKPKTGTDRSRALKDALYACCKPENFGRDYEGFGLPLP
ncbi:peptidase S8/S53 subtilisin kexin sedolisin [Bradyrhizobium guangzhouense]|uniref:Peptidase S8/S53 subtilisin kexin sedolisin n=1 Tax=Bradyrhizobium guangzhouense TaxID=1325095 RepID=A0ABY0DVH2_9BRAD|nr:S8 family serine peptidase [Bradyrhizobium guangzhouense]RXH05022.1 peptidase S8/S53 subtilisin kexin sedolisin [Bradyrhizobium guangzhouense]